MLAELAIPHQIDERVVRVRLALRQVLSVIVSGSTLIRVTGTSLGVGRRYTCKFGAQAVSATVQAGVGRQLKQVAQRTPGETTSPLSLFLYIFC